MTATELAARGAELAVFVGLPVGLLLARGLPVVRSLGPVILAYALGMLLGNQPWVAFDRAFALQVSSAAVGLAIPLLLFSVDVPGWLRLARSTVLSFSLATAGVVAAALITPQFFRGSLPLVDRMAGMLTGVYIGGTINMVSLGAALGVPSETFVLMNAVDMVTSTAYLLFVITVAQRVLACFLPPFPRHDDQEATEAAAPLSGRARLLAVLKAGGLAAAVVAVSALAGLALPGPMGDIAVIVAITTLAVGLSFVPRVRALPLTYETGLFFILVFCVSVGTTANFSSLTAEAMPVLAFTAALMCLGIAIHYVAAAFFRLDVDTVLVTSVAAIWAPPIIPVVVAALRNKRLLGPGIMSGLVGYAIANYLGLAVTWWLSS